MIVKIKDKEYSFDGYANPISSIQRLAEDIYQQGRADEQKEWKVSASELLIKYAGDIYEALPDMVEEIQTEAYKDAIDEFLEKCKVTIQEQNKRIEDDCPFLDIIDLQKIAEQLKEQNNE